MSRLLHVLTVALLSASVSFAFELHIGPSTITFAVQSQSLNLDQWFTALTLALTPLATHIAFGIPEPVLLSEHRPRVWDRLPHFNPVSIVWRYHAITYRRVRARCWDRADMAASNAVFWDGERWDATDSMMVRSRDWVTRLPVKSHVELVSSSSLATLVICLQAVQASVKSVMSLDYQHYDDKERFSTALPYVFFPLAVISILRLLCAPWLTNDYGYQQVDPWKATHDEIPFVDVQRADKSPLLEMVKSRLYSHRSRRARLFQIFWLISAIVPNTICLVIMPGAFGPRLGVVVDSASNIASRLLYMTIMVGLVLIPSLYILAGCAGSTVIPCIQAGWYKVFNLLCIFLAVTFFVLSALQTRVLPDGTYSSSIEGTDA